VDIGKGSEQSVLPDKGVAGQELGAENSACIAVELSSDLMQDTGGQLMLRVETGDARVNETMITAIPHRRPFLGKLGTSILKRRVRLIRWLACMRGYGKAPMECRYFGADFIVMPGEVIGDEIAIKRYEWWELTMMLMACRRYRPDVFIDVGANIGLYTCVLGRARAARRLLAFEPDCQNFARLADNIARNGLAAVVGARPVAVGAAEGAASLIPGTPENSGLTKLGDPNPRAHSVAVVALDNELDIRNRMICIKIDVEGHELEVLAGAVNLFRSNGGYAQIERHGDKRAAEITEIMNDFGWQFIDRCGPSLLFARVNPVG
jgi:FkbM family methyltransferase